MIDILQLLAGGAARQDPTRGTGHVFNPYGGGQAPNPANNRVSMQQKKTPWLQQTGLGGLSKADLLLSGMGMLSGRNFQEGMGNAAQYMAYGMDRASERQKEQAQKQAMMKALSGVDMTPEQRALAGANPQGVLGAVTKQAFAPPPGPVKLGNNEVLLDPNDPQNIIASNRAPEAAQERWEPIKPPNGMGGYWERSTTTGQTRRVAAPEKTGSDSTNPAGMPIELMKFEASLADDWKPVQNDYNDIRAQYQRITTLGADVGPDGQPLDPGQRAVNDLALTVAFTKMLDPGSVAREGEVALTQQAASLIGQAEAWLPRLREGKTLLPDATRKAMVAAASDMMPIYDNAYNSLAQSTQSRAKQYGLSPERIMLGYDTPETEKTKPTDIVWQAPSGVGVSQAELEEAASALVEDLTPQSMADFDQAYGPGAARMLLKELGMEEPSPAVPYAPYEPTAPYTQGAGPLR